MTAFYKKHSVWLLAIFSIAIISFSLVSQASTPRHLQNEDARGLIGRPAATPGYRPGLPAGTPGHRQPEDSIDVQSHPLSEPDSHDNENRPNRDWQREMDRE